MQTRMFSTYLPQIVKLRPETATEPPSAFSAGLLSKKYPSSEQQVAENRLYKASWRQTPPTPPKPTDPQLYSKSTVFYRCMYGMKW